MHRATVVDKQIMEALIDDGFEAVVIDVPGEGQPVLYKNNVVDVLRNQISLCSEEKDVFRPHNDFTGTVDKYEKLDHPVNTPYISDIYASLRREVMSSGDSSVRWIDDGAVMGKSFIGLVQIYTDKTVTTFKSNSLVAYPINVVFLNFKPRFRRFLIDNGYTLIGFLPVCYKSCAKL